MSHNSPLNAECSAARDTAAESLSAPQKSSPWHRGRTIHIQEQLKRSLSINHHRSTIVDQNYQHSQSSKTRIISHNYQSNTMININHKQISTTNENQQAATMVRVQGVNSIYHSLQVASGISGKKHATDMLSTFQRSDVYGWNADRPIIKHLAPWKVQLENHHLQRVCVRVVGRVGILFTLIYVECWSCWPQIVEVIGESWSFLIFLGCKSYIGSQEMSQFLGGCVFNRSSYCHFYVTPVHCMIILVV